MPMSCLVNCIHQVWNADDCRVIPLESHLIFSFLFIVVEVSVLLPYLVCFPYSQKFHDSCFLKPPRQFILILVGQYCSHCTATLPNRFDYVLYTKNLHPFGQKQGSVFICTLLFRKRIGINFYDPFYRTLSQNEELTWLCLQHLLSNWLPKYPTVHFSPFLSGCLSYRLGRLQQMEKQWNPQPSLHVN